MNQHLIQNLWAEVKTTLDLFQSDGTETSRIKAHERVLQLGRALERPKDMILKLSYSALKVAHDMNILHVLAQATSPVHLKELAAAKTADPLLVERMMRLLVANGFADEPSPCEYLPTAVSKEMTKYTSIGIMESLFLEFLPSIQKTPEYLQATNYRNPDDPMFAPLQFTHQFNTDGFIWLCQNLPPSPD